MEAALTTKCNGISRWLRPGRITVKRMIDALLAALALVVLSPVFLIVATAVRVGSGSPVLYRGARVGANGVSFRMLKFRTMILRAESLGASSVGDDDWRLTRVGIFLRRYKL